MLDVALVECGGSGEAVAGAPPDRRNARADADVRATNWLLVMRGTGSRGIMRAMLPEFGALLRDGYVLAGGIFGQQKVPCFRFLIS